MSDFKKLHLIRGLPGSGKSTLAARIAGEHVFEADQYFMVNGAYTWRGDRIKDAHADCQRRVAEAMFQGLTPLAVSNTFVKLKMMEPYEQLATQYGYTIHVTDLFDSGLTNDELYARNVHNVPLSQLEKMRQGYERLW